MRIREIINQTRRDFTADFECEHCGDIERKGGYDDAHYHRTVVPDMKCRACGKTAGEAYRPLATKYPEGEQV